MNESEYGFGIRQFIQAIDYLSKLYNRKVLSFSRPDDNSKMLIEYDKKTVSEYLQENIENKKVREFF